MNGALDHFARRVAADPTFLAHPLAEYARSEGLDDAGLAAALGCRVEDLTPIRLCGVPRIDPTDFRADVAAVAARFGFPPGKFAAVLRMARGLTKFRSATRATAEPGYLIAARDDEPKPTEGEPPP